MAKVPLVRFGLAVDAHLLAAFDAVVRERRCTRSELFRDLARAEVRRSQVQRGGAGVDAVAALTIVYDHHVRDLGERLTELQHQLGDGVRSAMHVHLSHDYCLETIVIRGRSDELQAVGDRILAMKGVKHGGIEIITGVWQEQGHAHPHANGRSHAHAHSHSHSHDHPHAHARPEAGAGNGRARVSAGGTARSSASGPAPGGRRAGPAKTGTARPRAEPPRRGRSRSG
jgi:CopG family nickel-responsive transcriptional regulator